jgi:ATP-dependent DNA helicase RecQ
LGDYDDIDITVDAKKILSAVYRMKSRYGIKTVIDSLKGGRAEKILRLRLDKLSTYGIMKGVSEQQIRDIINQLVSKEYLEITDSEYPVLRLGKKSKEVLFGNETVMMKTPKNKYIAAEAKEIARNNGNSRQTDAAKYNKPQKQGAADKELFKKLKQLRRELADAEGVPAYVIFSDATLKDMCEKLPKAEIDLLDVSGIGQTKLRKYGEEFVAAINEHCNAGPVQVQESRVEYFTFNIYG